MTFAFATALQTSQETEEAAKAATLAPASCRYEVAYEQPLATLGTFQTVVSLQGEKPRSSKIQFTVVSKTPRLNLFGTRCNIQAWCRHSWSTGRTLTNNLFKGEAVLSISFLQPGILLQQANEQLCTESCKT